MKLSLKIEGWERARAAVKALDPQTRDRIANVVEVTSFSARQRTIAGAPQESGLLRNSIQSTTSPRSLTGKVTIDAQAFYWRYHEYGTRFIPARPFVRPAREAEQAALDGRLRTAAQQIERDFSTGRNL